MWQRTVSLATVVLILSTAAPAWADPGPPERPGLSPVGYEALLAQEPVEKRQVPIAPPRKDPFTAAVFSALFPGAGQLYLGQFWPKTVAILGGEALALTAVILGDQVYNAAVAGVKDADYRNYSFGFYLGLASMVAIYLYSIVDAYTAAEDHNRRIEQEYIQDKTLGRRLVQPLDNQTVGFTWQLEL